MKALKILRIAFAMLTVFSLASCNNDPEWNDSEAHEKTEQLREQYTPFVIGTWHIEYIKDTMRFYECLTFNDDGTLKGVRKWQLRELVTIEGKELYTDWQDVDGDNGTFTGTWKLSWSRSLNSNRLMLWASFDGEHNRPSPEAYSLDAHFITANESALCIGGGTVRNGNDGSTIYTRGDAEPSF